MFSHLSSPVLAWRPLLRSTRVHRMGRLPAKGSLSPSLSVSLCCVRASSTAPSPTPTAIPQHSLYRVDEKNGKLEFGDYELIASQENTLARRYASVSALGTTNTNTNTNNNTDNSTNININNSINNSANNSTNNNINIHNNTIPSVGEKVWIRARIANVRAKGNACFLVLRGEGAYTVQACHFKSKEASLAEDSKKLIKFVSGLTLESIVDVYGTLVAAEVKACSQHNVEIHIDKIFTVSRAPAQLPFLLEDAARSQREIDSSQHSDRPLISVSQDVRLNNRWLDLRVPANNNIMKVRSAISLLFREALINEDFIEINTPKLLPGESEGGSEVFRTNYFGQTACLAQSPQLYKQMAISGDLNRVFEIGPVFRAEKSFTRRHLCEFTGLDIEMAINAHYGETLGVLHRLFRHIFEGLETRFSKQLEVIRSQYPSEPVRFTAEPLVIHWWDAIRMLRDAGHEVEDLEDLNTAQELALGEVVKQKFDADFYIVDQYPSKIRPFYTMPSAVNPVYSNSYDIFLRGQEICSGAQRCHDAAMLEKQMREKGVDPAPLSAYLESFRHGVSPHAGAGIGLDRVVFLYLGLDNVRKASMFPRDPHRCSP